MTLENESSAASKATSKQPISLGKRMRNCFVAVVCALVGIGLLLPDAMVAGVLIGIVALLLTAMGLNLFLTLKWSLITVVILLVLPFTAFPWMPGHSLVGGIFVECSGLECIAISASVLMAWWSLIFTQSLLVLDVRSRVNHRDVRFPSGGRVPDGFVPQWAQDFYGIPLGKVELVAIFVGSLPTLVILCWFAPVESSAFASAMFCAIGAIVFELIRAALMGFAMLAIVQRKFESRDVLVSGATKVLERSKHLHSFSIWIRWLLTLPFRFFARDLVKGEQVEWKADKSSRYHLQGQHYIASVIAAGTFFFLVALFFLIEPPGSMELPPAMLVLTLIVLVIWAFAFLDFHLGRRGIPVILVLGLALLPRQFSGDELHEYDVEMIARPELSPVDVVKASAGKNLVIVCAEGGGILSAGWTTYTLQKLIAARPELRQEIRLISGVSGGSVGAAFFVDELRRSTADPAKATERSVTSSLAAVTYGLVLPDLVRTITGTQDAWGLYPHDRGYYLDQRWQYIAQGESYSKDNPTKLSSLVSDIKRGAIPATIFNATAMESGRRVMITPVQFVASERVRTSRGSGYWVTPDKVNGDGRADSRRAKWRSVTDETPRADTHSEYLTGKVGTAGTLFADMNLWTAARLSATFPYVTPAARARYLPGSNETGLALPKAHHHMIDGGYHDNYGVASALDFLEFVVLDREAQGTELTFERIAILEVRAFPPRDPVSIPAANGAVAAVIGPIVGMAAIRDGAAVARNATELSRFIDHWNKMFRNPDGTPTVQIQSFVFEPSSGGEGTLSWHLAKSEVDKMKSYWEDGKKNSQLQEQLASLMRFLEIK